MIIRCSRKITFILVVCCIVTPIYSFGDCHFISLRIVLVNMGRSVLSFRLTGPMSDDNFAADNNLWLIVSFRWSFERRGDTLVFLQTSTKWRKFTILHFQRPLNFKSIIKHKTMWYEVMNTVLIQISLTFIGLHYQKSFVVTPSLTRTFWCLFHSQILFCNVSD